ncbi:MAG: superoxide dismutase [Bacteriovoracaceae bacterium]
MEHKLPELPYTKDALQPHLSAEALDFHYSKHHNAYVTKLNELIKGTPFAEMSLEEIITKADGAIFNNAAQNWNHTFYWHCLAPNGGGAPQGKLAEMINKKWGDFDKFKEEFTKSAIHNFGSGWTWLVANKQNEIEIYNTSNAQTPMTAGLKALLTLDIWEHAYYIDYRHGRPKYINAFWNLVNWNFVNKNL